ncbi:FUSC family protein, partial [Leptospira borgpetersenii serovar Ballum]|nr:FUSC family protein [Leptospira borgpetersenii serovar Ballum]
RDAQQMTENTLAASAQALREGNPSPLMAYRQKLAEIAQELRALMSEGQQGALVETPIHGYVWLSMEVAQQLERLSLLIYRALRK